ncbi:MAG TPA: helix-turn-helix domain-containing protein [Ktedonobacteraceae bacterium]|nr:helix-turn-helix domain-containing protein [Ktedonobacteraceae bacterium]
MSADTPQRSLREKLREVRAELILDVAEEMLAEKGYHDTSMDEIAALAGVAKGTLYQHFPGKEDLVFALFERNLVLFEQAVGQAASASLTARVKLERILSYVYQERRGQHARLLQLLYQNMEIRKGLLEKKGQLRDHMEQVAGQIRTILEEGKTEGAFDPAISTELMLLTFMSLLSLSTREHLLVQEQLLPAELVSQVGRVFFEGIASKQ